MEGLQQEALSPEMAIAAMALLATISLLSFLWVFARRSSKAEEHLRQADLNLEIVNKELESFSYSVAHDLKAPLRTISGYSSILNEDLGPKLDEEFKTMLIKINKSAVLMGDLIDGLLILSRVARSDMNISNVDLSSLAKVIVDNLQGRHSYRNAKFVIHEDLNVRGDYKLLTVALQNLFDNAWKYTANREQAEIEFGKTTKTNETFYYVKDNGVGFNASFAEKLFDEFYRLHPKGEYEGFGIGLATVKKIIAKHGGKVFAEGKEGAGATFYFSL